MLKLIGLFLLFCSYLSYSQNFDAEVLFHETKILVKENQLYKTESFKIKINNRGGEEYTKIAIPFSKIAKVKWIKGSIKDIFGNFIRELKKNDISERSYIANYSFYEDNFIKEFSLKHNSYPYIIEISFQVTQSGFFSIEDWVPVYSYRIPTEKAKLVVQVPKDYKILYNQQNIDEPIINNDVDKRNLIWETSYTDIIKPEIYAPRYYNYLPRLTIVPQKFNFAIEGSLDSWLTFGDWLYNLIKDLSELPKNEKNRVLSIVNGVTDTREKVKLLYHYLQDETRYVNISIETGGLKPYPASFVAQNKFGDCKGLTNYFKSVLESVGIFSYYTIVYADKSVKAIDKSLPSQQFNHVILCVPIERDTIWLDCTSDFAFNYLGTFTQNRDAFIIDNNNSHFVKTPSLSPTQASERRSVKFFYDVSGEAVANFNILYRGENYESLLSKSQSYNETDLSQIVRNNYIEKGVNLIEYKLVENHRDSTFVNFIYSAKTNSIYRNYGNEIMIKIIPFQIPKFAPSKSRKYPVQIDYPIYKIDTLDYQIPDLYTISGHLKNEEIINEFGSYKISYSISYPRVKVVKYFLLNSCFYSLDKYQAFYEFINKVYELENNCEILITKKNNK